MSISNIPSSASNFDATQAYGNAQRLLPERFMKNETSTASQESNPTSSFSQVMSNIVNNAIETGKVAENQTALALSGKGNMSDVVTSVEEAKMTLQTATGLRDRFVSAYQDIMRMSI